MEREHSEAPAVWIEQLARADEDIAQGRIVPGQVVIAELQAALVELEAEMAAEAVVTAHSSNR